VAVRVDVADPFDACRRARGSADGGADGVRPGGVFVETTGGQSGWGYFAVDPVRRLQVGSELESDATVPTLTELRGLLDGEVLVRGDCDVPNPCGAFGWLSYDVARELEALPGSTADDRGFPRLQLGVYDTVAAWEVPTEGRGGVTLRVTSCPRIDRRERGERGEDEDDGGTDAACERGRERALELARAAVEGEPGVAAPPVAADAAEGFPPVAENGLSTNRRGHPPVTTVLVVDNYDSFAYNLVQYAGEALQSLGVDPYESVVVRRNDAVNVDDIRALDPDAIVVSPGPGTPEEAGVSIPLFRELSYPMGICLGHQAPCAANGVPVGHAPEVVHGKPSTVTHDGESVFRDLPAEFRAGRYHSLAVEREDLAAPLVETARRGNEREAVMGVRHVEKPHEGVQFHTESILTSHGKRMVRAFCADALGRE
jgi:anthranilate synthase component 2